MPSLDDATDEAVVASHEPAKLGAASVLPLAPISNLSLSLRDFYGLLLKSLAFYVGPPDMGSNLKVSRSTD